MKLKWTGERLVTELDAAYGTFEHLHRYAVASELCIDKIVLDIASGEGYGTNLIATNAKFVWGVDISEEAIAHAKKKYNKENIQFFAGSAMSIPLEDDSVDVVVSFETLEHIVEQELFLSEVKRVLKQDGLLIISTPDKRIYHERDGNNPFHLKELSTIEFADLLSKSFRKIEIYDQRIFIGSVISRTNGGGGHQRFYDGSFEGISNELKPETFFNKPFFNLIVATDSTMPFESIPAISLFSAYKTYLRENERLNNQLSVAKNDLNIILNSRTYKTYRWLISNLLSPPAKLLRNIKNNTGKDGE